MDIVEFAEKLLGIEFLEYQKKLLREISEMPKDAVFTMTPRGPRFIDPSNIFRTQYQQEPVSSDKLNICPKCSGTGLDIRGVMCPKCQGSGHWKEVNTGRKREKKK